MPPKITRFTYFDGVSNPYYLGGGSEGEIYNLLELDNRSDLYHPTEEVVKLPTRESRLGQEYEIYEKIKGDKQLVENIVPIYDYIQFEPPSPYKDGIVMKRLSRTPRKAMDEQQDETQRMELISRIAKEILQGLREFQKAGYLHRDIKPDNIMQDKEGNWYIIDLGMAVHSSIEAKIAGTPIYLPPEAIDPKNISLETYDLYSVGEMLYQLLSLGKPSDEKLADQIFKGFKGFPYAYGTTAEDILQFEKPADPIVRSPYFTQSVA